MENYSLQLFETIVNAAKNDSLKIKPAVKRGEKNVFVLCTEDEEYPLAELIQPGKISEYEIK